MDPFEKLNREVQKSMARQVFRRLIIEGNPSLVLSIAQYNNLKQIEKEMIKWRLR